MCRRRAYGCIEPRYTPEHSSPRTEVLNPASLPAGGVRLRKRHGAGRLNSPDNLLLSSGTAPGPSRLSDNVPTRGVASRVAYVPRSMLKRGRLSWRPHYFRACVGAMSVIVKVFGCRLRTNGRRPPAAARNSGLFSQCYGPAESEGMRGGAGRIQTSKQTIMSERRRF
jgi:hypothetical protein